LHAFFTCYADPHISLKNHSNIVTTISYSCNSLPFSVLFD
jgi:hypothetical protein